jgi:hypothetical protein
VIIIVGIIGGLYFYDRNQQGFHREMYESEKNPLLNYPSDEAAKIEYQIRKERESVKTKMDAMRAEFEVEIEQVKAENDTTKRDEKISDLKKNLDDELQKAKDMINKAKKMKEESDMIRKEYEKKVVEIETLTKVVEDTGDDGVQENLNQMIKLTDEYEIAFTELRVESNKINDLAKIITQSVLEMKKYMDTQLPSV